MTTGGIVNKKLVAVAPLLLALAGCSAAGAEPAPTVTVTVAAEAPTPAETEKTRAEQIDDIYLGSLYKSDSGLKAFDRAELVKFGKRFCDVYDTGGTSSDINRIILKAAGVIYTARQMVTIHGAAVGAYCPEHISKIGS